MGDPAADGAALGHYPNDPYTLWCVANNTHHGHCPLGCEHPQPVGLADGRLVCGRCLFIDNVATEMVPCTPTNC